ncbi:MAG: asparagine synthetase A [Kineosporiaceae bacterium]
MTSTAVGLGEENDLVVRGGSWREPLHFLRALDNPWYRSLLDVQDVLTRSTFSFFGERGLKAVQLPITTTSISSPMGLGSDSSPVSIELFGVETYLADSMQFLLEYACRHASAGAFYLMPSFRGEAADESHLCQFYHAEAEIPGGIDDMMTLVEAYLRRLTADIADQCSQALATTAGDLGHIEAFLAHDGAFPRVTLEEAIVLLEDDSALVRHHPEGFRTLSRAGERRLIDLFGGVVWLTEQDHAAVPFYQAYVPGRPTQAQAADLLFGLGEVVGSGERHVTADDVRAALAQHEVDPTPYDWYLQLREASPLRTAGFGLGTERYVAWLLNHHDIRDCQLLPRFNGQPAIP